MNGIAESVQHSHHLRFADDMKSFKSVSSISDQALLQDDLNTLCHWAISVQLEFNLSKCTQVTFKPSPATSSLATSYDMLHCSLSCNDTCKELIVSNNITWDKHYEYIIARAYKIVGLIRHTFSVSHSSL